MRIVRTVADLRQELRPYRTGGSIALVPTMGALHDGHLQLARRARAENDVVVMSIFVNPTQFNDPADLNAYPRDEQADTELAASAGVDLLFMPAAAEVYPPGFSATVQLHGPIVETLEGSRRGVGHFQASPPWSANCSAWPSPTGPTSARRMPSRPGWCGPWSPT